MDSTRSSRWTRSVALGMLVVAAVVGNASPRASDTASIVDAPAFPAKIPIDASVESNLVLAHGQHLMAIASQGSDRADENQRGGESVAPGSPDDSGQLVPALYAWDPDVRFVFYRHVSKWM